MGKNTLAPGFRFHPTDVELIMYYLKRKILGKKFSANPIAEVDIYKCAPWDLPDKSCLKTGDLKWHFYCPISKKYGRGARVNRANVYGYWKATGKDRPVKYNDEVVGMIKTLVFHQGKAPRGDRTDWVMHEYRLEEKKLADRGIVQDSYMLYVVFKKDGVGPKNGAQYGAPFKEDDWSDDDDGEETNFPGTGSLCGTLMVGVASGSCIPESLCVGTTVDSSGVHSHTLSLVGHTTCANDDVNCTIFTDADAYTVPMSMDTPEAPMVVGTDSVPAPLEAPQLAQYGAPFKEDDWSDDDDEETNFPGTGSLCGTLMVGVASGSCIPESLCVGTTVDSSGVHSHTLPLVGHTTRTNDDVNCITFTDADAYTVPMSMDTPEAPLVVGADSVPAPLEAPQLALVPQDQEPNDNNIVSMLEAFTEDHDQIFGNVTDSFIEAANVSEEDDILSMLAAFTEVDNSNNWCL